MTPVLLALFLSASPVHASEADSIRASLVLATRSAAPPTDTISREAILRSAGLADAISRFSGLQVKDYGGAGGLKTVNVRSLGSEHTAVYLDGIPIDNAQNMQVDLGRLGTSDLSGVSLYSGGRTSPLQSAREWGSAASVHMETARPSPSAGGGRLSGRLDGGSMATFSPSVTFEGNLSKRLALRAEGTVYSTSGRYKFRVPDGETSLTRENADLRSIRTAASLYGRSWKVRASYYGSERGFPGPVVRRAEVFPLSAERQEDRSFLLQGSWLGDVSGHGSLAVRCKISNDYTHYDTHPENNPMALPYDVTYRQSSGYLSSSYRLSLGRWAVDLAADGLYSALESGSPSFAAQRRLTVYGASALSYASGRLNASAGLLWTGARDRFRNPSSGGAWTVKGGFRSAFSPSLAATFTVGPGMEVHAFARRSWRMPSFNDLYYTVIGNSNLSPEDARQVSVSLRGRTTIGRIAVSGRLDAYHNSVRDKIVAIPTASQFRWTMLNIGKAGITGLEPVLSMRAPSGGLTLRYTYQKALDRTDPGSATYGNQIPYIPVHSGSITGDLSIKGVTASFTTILTGTRYSRSAAVEQYRIEPWSTTDLTVSSPEFQAGRRLSLQGLLSVRNLFNARYEVVRGYPMPGTNFLLTLLLTAI